MKKASVTPDLPTRDKGAFYRFLVSLLRRNGVGCKERKRMMNALRAGLEASVWVAIGRAKTAETVAKHISAAMTAGGYQANREAIISAVCNMAKDRGLAVMA